MKIGSIHFVSLHASLITNLGSLSMHELWAFMIMCTIHYVWVYIHVHVIMCNLWHKRSQILMLNLNTLFQDRRRELGIVYIHNNHSVSLQYELGARACLQEGKKSTRIISGGILAYSWLRLSQQFQKNHFQKSTLTSSSLFMNKNN